MSKKTSPKGQNDPTHALRAAAGLEKSKAVVLHLEAAREQIEAAQRDFSSVYGASKECESLKKIRTQIQKLIVCVQHENTYVLDHVPSANESCHVGCNPSNDMATMYTRAALKAK